MQWRLVLWVSFTFTEIYNFDNHTNLKNDITSNDDEEEEPEANMDVDLATAISEIDKNKEILLTL